MVSASAAWTGAWTQRLYGTGGSDVWEVFTDNCIVTQVASQQGWRSLKPLMDCEFRNKVFQEYLTETLDVRDPRLLVIKCPSKLWHKCDRLVCNSSRQKKKTVAEALEPYLSVAFDVARDRLECNRDFVMEIHCKSVFMDHKLVKCFIEDPNVYILSLIHI